MKSFLFFIFSIGLSFSLQAERVVVECSGESPLREEFTLKIYESKHPVYRAELEFVTDESLLRQDFKELSYKGGLHQYFYCQDDDGDEMTHEFCLHIDEFVEVMAFKQVEATYNSSIQGVQNLPLVATCCAYNSATFPLERCQVN